jgi:hypothetical protein
MHFFAKGFFTAGLLFLICAESGAQTPDTAVTTIPHAVINIEHNNDFSGFGLLDTIVNNYRVFFVGENHTFRESNSKLELKMFKYLYHKASVRNLFFELGYSRGWLVDKYVQTGDTAIYHILENYSYASYAELYKGLMEFNRGLDSGQKIRVIGLDVERFFELSTKALSMILPESEAPPEISLHIESLAGLAAYFDKYLRESRLDEFTGKFTSGSYSAANTVGAIIKNFKEQREIYKTYLGENFGHFEIIIQSLEKHEIWNKFDDDKMIQEYVFREQYMYEQFQKVLQMYPGEKFFGQFGRCHVATVKQKEACNWYEYNSIASRISNSSDTSVRGKVLSIACFYPRSDQFDQLVDEYSELKKMGPLAADDSLTLFILPKDTSVKNRLSDRYQGIIINNTSKDGKVFPRKEEFTSPPPLLYFSLSYGNKFINFSGLNTVFSSMGNVKIKNMMQEFGFNVASQFEQFNIKVGFAGFVPVKARLNDSTEALVSGMTSLTYFGYDLAPGKWLDVVPSFGFGAGYMQLRVDQTNSPASLQRGFFGENSVRIYANPAFLLDAGMNVNVNIKMLSIGAYSSYTMDPSNQRWRQFDNKLIKESTKTSMSGFRAGITLGIVIKGKE